MISSQRGNVFLSCRFSAKVDPMTHDNNLMENSQAGLFAMGTSSHIYLEFALVPNANPAKLVKAAANLEMPRSTVSGSNMVIGIRPSIWALLAPNQTPPQTLDFSEPIIGPDGFTIPATQRDLWIWIASGSPGQAFDAAVAAIDALAPHSVLAEEIVAWSYHENRDLIGFIDGTANPSLLEAPQVTLIPSGSPGAYGSILLFQKWRHDLKSFERLSVDAQEAVIGRTKQYSEEFEEELLPPDSHVARTTLVDGHGIERPIFRRNTAYGSPTENGTVFVGFSMEQSRLHTMLERMSGIPDGTRDALTFYSTPMSGSYYYIPSADALRKFVDRPDSPSIQWTVVE
jgi:putative iron-dependent peroxidase